MVMIFSLKRLWGILFVNRRNVSVSKMQNLFYYIVRIRMSEETITMHKEKDSSLTFSDMDFNSRTNLNKNENGSKDSIDHENDYIPFEHRVVEHPNSTLGALLHILKGFIGTGILAMPSAFKSMGLISGFCGTIAVGCLNTYCIYMLVNASTEICKRSKTPSLGFAESAGKIFEYGPKKIRKFSAAAVYSINAILCIGCMMSSCVYVVFISENLKQLFDYWFPEHVFSIYCYMLFIMAPVLCLTQIKELKHLVPFSFLANVLMAVSFGITFYYMLNDIPDPNTRDFSTGFTKIPTFFSTVLYAISSMSIILPVENSMSKPQHFLGCPGVLNIATFTVTVLYASLGFFGYLKYGEDTKGSISLNLPVHETPAQVVKLLIALSVFFSYFLKMYVPLDITRKAFIESRVKGTGKKIICNVMHRCVFVLITIGVAAAVPDLEPIIGLVGAIACSTQVFLIPAIMETVILWEGELGLFKWRLLKNVTLGVVALLTLVTGTIQSIEKIK